MRPLKLITFVLLIAACNKAGTIATYGAADSSTPGIEKSQVQSCTLRLLPNQGQKYSYEITIGTGSLLQMAMRFSMLAERVDGDHVTFLTTFDGMQSQGQELPEETLAEIRRIRTRTVMHSTGRWVSSSSEGLPPGQAEPNTTFGVSFPTGSVRVGDEWEGISNSEGKQVNVRCKLTGFDVVDSTKVAVIDVTVIGDAGLSLTLNGPQRVAIELSSGMVMQGSLRAKSAEIAPFGRRSEEYEVEKSVVA
jgi:hypothetical protein